MRTKVWRNEFYSMSDSNDDELKLTQEYKYLLAYIRPLIDQLDKSRDAQLCLLWLSKLEQCASWEKAYRNKILSELCKQVKTNCLKPPFNTSPPSGSLRKIACGNCNELDWTINDSEEEEEEGSTEDPVSSSSLRSFSTTRNSFQPQSEIAQWKEEHECGNFKNKCLARNAKDGVDHSECLTIQKAYHERAQSDQMVIERYQEIIKSLVSQQLKADISPSKLKKFQSTYETKISELIYSLKKVQEENELLKGKFEGINCELINFRNENEELKQQSLNLENDKKLLEAKCGQIEEEKIKAIKDLLGKLSDSEKKFKDSEKRIKLLEKRHEESYHDIRNECEAENAEKEKKYFAEISNLERLLDEKQAELICLQEQFSKKCNQYENEISRLKQECLENYDVEKDKKKIKILKSKAKKLEKIQEHMAILFQTQLQQILAKKDFYIETLEMQLKMNNTESGTIDLNADLHNLLNQKVSNLEAQYRKLLEDSEQQYLQRRKLDLQKIHTLEKQLLLYGGTTEDGESGLNQLKTRSLTSVTAAESEAKTGRLL